MHCTRSRPKQQYTSNSPAFVSALHIHITYNMSKFSKADNNVSCAPTQECFQFGNFRQPVSLHANGTVAAL